MFELNECAHTSHPLLLALLCALIWVYKLSETYTAYIYFSSKLYSILRNSNCKTNLISSTCLWDIQMYISSTNKYEKVIQKKKLNKKSIIFFFKYRNNQQINNCTKNI